MDVVGRGRSNVMDTLSEAMLDELAGFDYGEWEQATWLIDPPDRTFANNAPLFDFKCVQCGLYCESHVNESQIWSCPRCYVVHTERSPLRKVIRKAPSMPPMWHGHFNHSIGQYITDRKQFKEGLYVKQEEATERFDWQQSFIEVDPNDRDSLGITDEGLDSTHDAHVSLGIKESKGRFVFPMSG